MSPAIKTILARIGVQLKQPTTRAGIVFILGSIGYELSDEWADILFQGSVILSGLILMFTTERPDKPLVLPKEEK